MAGQPKSNLGFPVDTFIASLAKVGITCTIREKLTPEQQLNRLQAYDAYSQLIDPNIKAKDEFRRRVAKKI